ncbi:MAG: hypothetical protein NVSMB42_18980 [Herpetosiphon sp.]
MPVVSDGRLRGMVVSPCAGVAGERGMICTTPVDVVMGGRLPPAPPQAAHAATAINQVIERHIISLILYQPGMAAAGFGW